MMSAVDDYLSILNGDNNITFHHVEEENDVLKIVTVYNQDNKHRLIYTVGGEIMIDQEFSSIMLVMRIVESLMPASFKYG